ncbi:electron transport complex subunit RsxA [Christensenellaceae bacterium OttesenSCG-928-K19]|nr:electron transport complex subunit RsxA [Christensenellaceae bacterium OttesenSCG-928-K19]
MEQFIRILAILLSSILVNNYVLSRFLGICPFLGVSKKVPTAMGMGMAVTFVMALASLITWLVQYYILEPLGVGYMQTIAFILVIAALVQLVEMILQKSSPALYQSLGVYLPLITTNCAVLGVAILNITEQYNLLETVINGVGAALGFTLAIVLFAGIRERMELNPAPYKALDGFPIALISASLMSVAFMGFSGLAIG